MRLNRVLGGAAVAGAMLVAIVSDGNTDDWSNARGGADRDGHRAGKAELTQPQVYWEQRLGGGLATGAMWVQGNGNPATYVAFGGHVYAKTWGDSTQWGTDLLGITHVIARTDLDRDGIDDAIVAVSRDAANPAVTLLDLNGFVLWSAPRDDLGPLSTGVRIADLDGDGVLDLYVTPWREGFAGKQAVAYSFANGISQGEAMWKLDAEQRDYFAGFYDLVGEFDGTPGMEILALGHERVYTYDAATGVLESESSNLGPLPFARATLRPVDIEADGVQEILAYSNEAWTADENRRHVSLFAWDDNSAAMAMVWTREVLDVVNDRVSFADDSGGDLDNDDRIEVVFGVFDAASGVWTTEARDAGTGALLYSLAGERFEAVVAHPLLADSLVFTHDDGGPLRVYTFDRTAGFVLVATLGDRRVASCLDQSAVQTEAPKMRGCVITNDGDPAVVLTKVEAATGRITGLEVVDLSAGSFTLIGQRDADDGVSLSAVWPIDAPGPARVAVAESSGAIRAYDAALRVPPATVKPPYAWSGIPYGTKFSGTDVAPFPLVVPGPEAAERVLTLSGAANAKLLDASDGGSIAGGAAVIWQANGATRAVAVATPSPAVSLFDDQNGIITVSALDGGEIWRTNGLFDSENGLLLHGDPLRVDMPTGGASALWFHRRDANRGSFDLTIVDGATGAQIYSEPTIDINNSGWRRLSLAQSADATPRVYSGRLTEIWQFDSATGAVVDSYAVGSGTLSIPVPRQGMDSALLSIGLDAVSLIEPSDGSIVWQTLLPNRPARFGGLLEVNGAMYYATAEADTSLLRIMGLETGAIETTLALNDGFASTDLPSPSAANGVLSNTTAVDDLFGDGTPAWLVGSTDGHVYAISAVDHSMLWSLYVGAGVGEIVMADWDGDGSLELVVSVQNGRLLGIDRFVLEAPGWVYDVDPPGGSPLDDVDTIRTHDTLYAVWAPVDAAESYEVAVFTNEGERVTAGFVNVGDVTEATLEGLPVVVGGRYVAAVRAVTAEGSSVDAVSDGVTIVADDVPGEPVGGCCSAGSNGLAGHLLLALLVGVALLVRRRRA